MIHKGDEHDPKGLIYESYRIDGITKSECRTIFLDWALSLPVGQEARDVIDHLLAQYEGDNPQHPMTEVLHEGRQATEKPRRRGGWRGRNRPA